MGIILWELCNYCGKIKRERESPNLGSNQGNETVVAGGKKIKSFYVVPKMCCISFHVNGGWQLWSDVEHYNFIWGVNIYCI